MTALKLTTIGTSTGAVILTMQGLAAGTLTEKELAARNARNAQPQ